LAGKDPVNREFVPNIPKRPQQGSACHPKDPLRLTPLSMEEPKDIRETRRVPSVAEQFPNCTPHEPSEGTVEKDVIVIFNFPT
jgi:hypothetical protein